MKRPKQPKGTVRDRRGKQRRGPKPKGPLSRTKRRRLVEDARRLANVIWPGSTRDGLGSCSLVSIALQILAARRHELPLMLQVGSAAWRRLPEDNGEPDIDFGYHWQGAEDRTTRLLLQHGRLPECHVWLADGTTREIIDPTSGDFPELCRSLSGLDWPGPRPPAWVWETADRLRERTAPRGFYIPSEEATPLIDRLLMPAYNEALAHFGLAPIPGPGQVEGGDTDAQPTGERP